MAEQLKQALARKRARERWQPLLLDAEESAAFLGVSLRKYYELRASGQLPPPVRLGERIVKQRRSDLIAFVEQLEVASSIPEPVQLVQGKRKRREGVPA